MASDLPGHSIAWTLDPGYRVDATFTCHEPPDALCRTQCKQPECQEACADRAHDALREPLEYCNAVEWLRSEDAADTFVGPRNTPVRDGLINPVWRNDHYGWEYA